jgi:outer membrane protein
MMTNLTRTLGAVTLAAALFSPSAFAQSKVGYVDLRRVMGESPQAHDVRTTLESEFGPRSKQLEAMGKDLQARGQKFERDQPTMSDAERAKTQKDLRDTQIAFERRKKELEEDVEIRKNEELSKFQRMIFEEVQKVARAQTYDLVLTDVMYAADSVDLTAQVLASLQARAKAQAAAAPAAPAPATPPAKPATSH